MWKGFKEFILRGSVIELAVAVVVGVAFGQVVNSFVADVLMPAISTIGGIPDFSAIRVGPIALGKFLNAVLNFLIVTAAIYFLVILPMNKLKERKKISDSASKSSEEAQLLGAILDELRRKG